MRYLDFKQQTARVLNAVSLGAQSSCPQCPVGDPGGGSREKAQVIDVWASNFEEEAEIMRNVVEKYPYIAMDVRLPGIVARPTGPFENTDEYNYRFMKANVDLVKIVQGRCCWKLNFKFNLLTDLYAADRVEVLGSSVEVGGAGLDFAVAMHRGIEHDVFGEFLMSSGIVLSEEVAWLVSSGGIVFASLLKILTGKPLPDHHSQFSELVAEYFPRLYDIKILGRDPAVSNLSYSAYDLGDTVRIIDAFFGNLDKPGDEDCSTSSSRTSGSVITSSSVEGSSQRYSKSLWRSSIYRCAGPPPPPPPPMPPVGYRGPPPAIPPPPPPPVPPPPPATFEHRHHPSPPSGGLAGFNGPNGKLLRYEGPPPPIRVHSSRGGP
ncbi:CCR4-NOT transcription complex subunit 8 [Perkinsus olseni]|uniref:CCR4-NOT transcription complex subunit 8 n=1 Tax=Perkinsus olseni TaxID=32597 RepID=A0A7J6PH37_PEROL|nr:CCR4-NOT transcription complex subunit 8 [Perkinsus olseni]